MIPENLRDPMVPRLDADSLRDRDPHVVKRAIDLASTPIFRSVHEIALRSLQKKPSQSRGHSFRREVFEDMLSQADRQAGDLNPFGRFKIYEPVDLIQSSITKILGVRIEARFSEQALGGSILFERLDPIRLPFINGQVVSLEKWNATVPPIRQYRSPITVIGCIAGTCDDGVIVRFRDARGFVGQIHSYWVSRIDQDDYDLLD